MIGLRSYDAATGRLNILAVGPALDDWSVAALGFDYDRVGNLRERADWLTGLQETFVYDELNRLTNVNGPAPKVYAYDLTGNLTSKTDVGSYAYRTGGSTRPHAVTQISLPIAEQVVKETHFNYDPNGSLLNSTWQERNTQTQQIVRSGPGHTVTWTGFNMPAQIQTAGSNMLISYGPEHQKVKRVQGNGTLVYPLPNYEKFTRSDGLIEHRHNLYAGRNLVGQYTERRGTISNEAVYYFHRDHLGSIAVISDEAGAPVERHSHDAFGLRRNPDGLDDPAGTLTSAITRIGYTGHDNVRLIDMNARVYDPLVGRFMSADPTIPRPFDTQSWNRYSYASNNPLSRIDKDGLTDSCAWQDCDLPDPTELARLLGVPSSVINEWLRESVFTIVNFEDAEAFVAEFNRQGIRHLRVDITMAKAGGVGVALAAIVTAGILDGSYALYEYLSDPKANPTLQGAITTYIGGFLTGAAAAAVGLGITAAMPGPHGAVIGGIAAYATNKLGLEITAQYVKELDRRLAQERARRQSDVTVLPSDIERERERICRAGITEINVPGPTRFECEGNVCTVTAVKDTIEYILDTDCWY